LDPSFFFPLKKKRSNIHFYEIFCEILKGYYGDFVCVCMCVFVCVCVSVVNRGDM